MRTTHMPEHKEKSMPENGDVPAEFEAEQDSTAEQEKALEAKLAERLQDVAAAQPAVVRNPLEGATGRIMSPAEGYPWRVDVLATDGTVIGTVPLSDSDGSLLARALQPKEEHPHLSKYEAGERVQVLKQGAWLAGVITGKQAGALYVDTERGPVTVMSALTIKKN